MARMAVPQERMRSQAPSADISEVPASATAIAPMAELVIQSEPREALLRLLELRKANKHEEAAVAGAAQGRLPATGYRG